MRGVASGVKHESSDDVTKAAKMKTFFAGDKKDIKPYVDWTDYYDDYNFYFALPFFIWLSFIFIFNCNSVV